MSTAASRSMVGKACLTGWFVLATALTASAQTWDLTAEFSTTSNPTGPWWYGWEMSTGPSWTLFDAYTDFQYVGLNPTWTSGTTTPSLWLNLTSEGFDGAPLNWLSIHPGPNGEPSVIRWISPISGDVRLDGAFLAGDIGLMDVYIQVNGVTIWNALDFNSDQAFSLNQAVAVGDQLDWLVTGGWAYGNTPVSIHITEVVIFSDGFESGNTAPWSETVPPLPCTMLFDDAYAQFGQGSEPEWFYAIYGVTFNNDWGYGVIGGMSNGNPGSWNVEGTNGPAAWGLWPGPHAIYFESPVTGVSLDILRGIEDATITLDAYLDGALVDSQVATVSGPFDFETVSFAGPIDTIGWEHHPYVFGIDNIRYSGLPSCP